MSTVNFGGSPARYQLDVDAAIVALDIAANYTDIYARIIVRRINGTGFSTNNPQPWNFYVNGVHIASGTWTYNFGGSSTVDNMVWQGTWRHWHNADGTATPQTYTGFVQMDSGLGSASTGGTITPPRNPRGPRCKSGGTWRNTVAYVKHAGTWRIAIPYVRQGGTWKVGGA